MSSTSAPSRPADVPAPAPVGSGRVHRSLPPRGSATGRLPGRFRGDPATGSWWWSPELYALHGLSAGTVEPSVQLLLAHVHTDDRSAVRDALATAGTSGTPFAREHRVLRADGGQRTVLLVCEPETDASGAVVALAGLLVEVAAARPAAPEDEHVRHLETEVEQLRSAMASRAAIEQAKGILMLLMSCGDQVAFDLLAHISSHTHRKVRDVALAIIDSASGARPLPDDIRDILHDATPPSRPAG